MKKKAHKKRIKRKTFYKEPKFTKENSNYHNWSSIKVGLININKKLIKKINNKEKEDYNTMPYTQALRLDHRRIHVIYLSIIKKKIDLLNILFFPEEYTHRALLISIYSLDFIFNYFMNGLLYSDDVISQKYHNNGTLTFATSLLLSLISTIISNIVMLIVKLLTNYHEYLKEMVQNIANKKSFNLLYNKLYKCIKIKVSIYFFFNFLICLITTYYLLVFGIIYKKSQISLLFNYLYGIIESLLYSFEISLVVCIMRFFSLKCQIKQLYRTSVYLNNLL